MFWRFAIAHFMAEFLIKQKKKYDFHVIMAIAYLAPNM